MGPKRLISGMFFACRSINTGASSSLIYSVMRCGVCRGLPGGKSLSFASPKESNQRKGDPQPGPLRGSLKKLKEPENLETSRLCRRRTSKFFNPSPSAFSSPARTGRGKMRSRTSSLSLRERAGVRASPNPIAYFIPHPVLAGLRSTGGSGNKFLDVRRRRSWLVSKNSAAFEHRKLPEAKCRDPDCGSPFFSLGFFGEAKKSKSPAGASPGMLARGTSIATTQRRRQEANK